MTIRINLSWEVRQRADIIAGQHRLGGKLHSGQLHAIAGVPGEADHYVVPFLHGFLQGGSHWVRRHELFSSLYGHGEHIAG